MYKNHGMIVQYYNLLNNSTCIFFIGLVACINIIITTTGYCRMIGRRRRLGQWRLSNRCWLCCTQTMTLLFKLFHHFDVMTIINIRYYPYYIPNKVYNMRSINPKLTRYWWNIRCLLMIIFSSFFCFSLFYSTGECWTVYKSNDLIKTQGL